MIKPIVTNLAELKRPCIPVTKEDDIKQIIIDLKETLQSHSIGWGLAANQIGYDKAICYIRVPKTINHKEKKITYAELVLINPKIIEKDTPVKVIGTRHGEKLYETLVTREEMARTEDMGNYYRIPCDTRDLNYDKYFVEGQEKVSVIEDYHSHNTHRLDVEEMKSLLMQLSEIRERVNEQNA